MTKRIIAILLTVILIIALVGCGEKKRQPIVLTLSTEDAEAILAAAGIMLPDAESAPGAGTTVRYYYYYDDFHNYSEAEIIQTGYWTFQNKYNGNVEWIETTYEERYTRLANYVLAGDIPDFYPAWAETFPMYFLNGMFTSVDDYIDYDDPLFADLKYHADNFFSLGDRHYVMLTDVQNNSMILYNRRVFDEWGFDDPAELYWNDKWTWDVMRDMAYDFCDPDDGRYAFNGWHIETTFISSTGVGLVELDPSTGMFVSNADDPRLERAANYLADFQKNECNFPMWTNGWVLNYGDEGGGMKEGVTLFAMSPAYALTEMNTQEEEEARFGDFTNKEVMVVPVPRDPNGDGEYYIDCIPKGYLLIKGAPNPEGVALLAMCDRFKTIDPTVVRIDVQQKIDKLGWNDEMIDMWNHMYDLAHSHNTVIEYGGGIHHASSVVDSILNYSRNGGDTTWAQRKEQYQDTLDFYLEELNAEINEFIANGGA